MDHDIAVVIHEADRDEPDFTIILTPIDGGKHLPLKDQSCFLKTHTVLVVVRFVLGIMPFEPEFHLLQFPFGFNAI